MRYIKTNASGRYANIKLYDIFRKDLRLPDAKAQELVQALNESARESQDDHLQDLATKEFVREEILALKGEFRSFKGEFHSFKDDITGQFHGLQVRVAETRTELTKSIFWTSLIQFLAIMGSVIGIIGFMLRK